jgi:putative hydrolase of the HAD superfamily
VFDPALDALGVEPDRAIYVGDSFRYDVGGARARGLHPVHLDPYDLHAGDHDRVLSLAEVVDHLA